VNYKDFYDLKDKIDQVKFDQVKFDQVKFDQDPKLIALTTTNPARITHRVYKAGTGINTPIIIRLVSMKPQECKKRLI
jgi:hypothetical protein